MEGRRDGEGERDGERERKQIRRQKACGEGSNKDGGLMQEGGRDGEIRGRESL